MTKWRGVFPAVTTKLRQDGSIDLKATQASMDRLILNGVSGVIVLPMLGENASLDPAEREQVIRAAKEVVAGRVPLLSGLAAISTADATASARALSILRRRRADGLPEPCLQDRSARDGRMVQGRRRGLRHPDHDLQQSHRLWRRCDAGDPATRWSARRTSSASRRRAATSAASPTSTTAWRSLRRSSAVSMTCILESVALGRDRLGLRHDQCLAGRMRRDLQPLRGRATSTRRARSTA